MYRWLLCWRYLRTRYIALASVVSVTLGVATLIIVNSVMDGFTSEMQGRMHGILSDVIVESHSANGIANHRAIEENIRKIVGNDLVGLTTVVHVPAMVSIKHRNDSITRQINLIGIDTDTYSNVSDFSKYLLHPDNQAQLSFLLQESGYAPGRKGFPDSGWGYRRSRAAREKQLRELIEKQKKLTEIEEQRNEFLREQIAAAGNESVSGENPVTAATSPASDETLPDHGLAFPPALAQADTAQMVTQSPSASVNGPSFDGVLTPEEQQASVFDPETDQWDGVVLGISIGSTRWRNPDDGEVEDYYYVQPGDDVSITFPSAGENPRACNAKFTVVDFYESKMSEYDATFAFVPLDKLQKARGMQDAVSSIQLKLRDGADLDQVRNNLRAAYPAELGINVNTWRDLQGALLAAVEMETTILNILLFLIIAVAGFGILATFFMIVVEKTKDIGILKSLGASGTGVATIFLGYGVLLGAFGAGVGAIAGLLFVAYINNIADVLESVTGREVFDPTVYYFETIPTIVHPLTVVWVIIGAIAIAVMASVLPSIRAARMHPVKALRYE